MKNFPLWIAIICLGSYLALRSEDDAACVTLSFFYTGELQGELEPCGCSGMKSGGMILRSSWVNYFKTQYRYLYLVDGGFAPLEDTRQSEIKSTYHHLMLHQLSYDYCVLSRKEKISGVEKPPALLGARDDVPSFEVRQIGTSHYTWRILFLAIEEGRRPPRAAIEELLQNVAPDVVFIFARGIYQNYTSLVPGGKYAVLIFLVDAQEPFSPLTPEDGFFVLSAGNRGRYAGLFELTLDKHQMVSWNNRIIALEAKYTPDPGVVSLLEGYKEQVKEERLLERQIKQISPVGFVGSDTCGLCHEYEYEQWSLGPHARAFTTLEKENYHWDPECVGCHVAGYAYEEGFRSVEETPHLIHVGCESCHGAGAEHAVVGDAHSGKPDVYTCLACHLPVRSPHFEYTTYKEKIKHWRDN